jgi:hypothetical protein
MVFERARRIGRVFAVALLAWTAVDVLDYGVCANHRDPFPGCAPVSVGGAAPNAPADPAGPLHDHAGDCFCCSPYVDVQAPFSVTLTYTVKWALTPEAVARPVFGAARLYHPPLA